MTEIPQAEWCGDRGPRIGNEGAMVCVLPAGHEGQHEGDPSWRQCGWPNDRPVFRHPDLPSPQPDTAPEGGVVQALVANYPADLVDALHGHHGDDAEIDALREWLRRLLNGAPASPAERAVIDAAVGVIDEMDRKHSSDLVKVRRAVARLRSERNKTDG